MTENYLIEGSRPITDVVAVLRLVGEEALPTVLYEFSSKHAHDIVPVLSIARFARPRGWYSTITLSEQEYFYQLLTTETGDRRHGYVLISWEKKDPDDLSNSTDEFNAVSFIVISRCFNPEAFRVRLLEKLAPTPEYQKSPGETTINFKPGYFWHSEKVQTAKEERWETMHIRERGTVDMELTMYSDRKQFTNVVLLEISKLMRSKQRLDEKLDAEALISALLWERVRSGSLKTLTTNEISVTFPGESTSNLGYTGTDVAFLFKYLGMQNVVSLVHAILSDARIVLVSSSMMRLSRAQNALLSLIYPFTYLHSCITVLPESLSELLESPTPFLIGVISDLIVEGDDEHIQVLLDRGEIRVPTTAVIYKSVEAYTEKLFRRLLKVLFPESGADDNAISESNVPDCRASSKDKQLRACFMLYFNEILFGYQYFALYSRLKGVHLAPKSRASAITFHSSAFAGFRNFNSAFTTHLLNSSYFQSFIASRAIPFRQLDIFDKVSRCEELDECIHNQKTAPRLDNHGLLESISSELLERESFLETRKGQKSVSESTATLRRINVITATQRADNNNVGIKENVVQLGAAEIVPVPDMSAHMDYHRNIKQFHTHRLQALATFICSLFGKEMSSVRKRFQAVELSMRFVPLRVELCRLLAQNASHSVLESEQFNALTRLINAALERETIADQYGVIYKILHLSTVYCRKLPRGVYQYCYTVIQHHKVWKNVHFWANCFYYDIHTVCFPANEDESKNVSSLWNLTSRPCAMEICAAEAAKCKNERLEDLVQQENDIIQAQAKHFINLMICLLVPLNVHGNRANDNMDRTLTNGVELNINGYKKDDSVNTVADRDFSTEIIEDVAKWIGTALDRILSASGRGNNILNSEIHKYVDAHADSLHDTFIESSAFAQSVKPRIPDPALLAPNEFLIHDPVPCFLLVNGHEMAMPRADTEIDTAVLPAEGMLHLTNYRVIFKGRPTNISMSHEIVVYTIPLLALETIKRCSLKKCSLRQLKTPEDIHTVFLLRSRLFHIIKVAFSTEANGAFVDQLLETLKGKSCEIFAYGTVQNLISHATIPADNHHKFSTIVGIKRFEGLRKKGESWTLRDLSGHRGSYSLNCDISEVDQNSLYGPEICRRFAAIDFERLGFNRNNTALRISYANHNYKLCKTYPTFFVVPAETSDSNLSKVAKGFVENRFPVVVWANSAGALLIRSSSFASLDVVKKFKKAVSHNRNTLSTLKSAAASGGSQQTLNSKASSDEASSNFIFNTEMKSAEAQAHYLTRLAAASPLHMADMIFAYGSMDSVAVDEIPITTFDNDCVSVGGSSVGEENEQEPCSPDVLRRNVAIRSSGFLGKRQDTGSLAGRSSNQGSTKHLRKSLYLLIEKGTNVKTRIDPNTEIVVVKYPKDSAMRRSFSRLIEVMRNDVDDSEHDLKKSFLENWHWSAWPSMLSVMLSLANSAVAIMHLNKSSVAICLDHGRTATAQITSLVELLSDPFYRTFTGFQVLIEKEWLAMGYDFTKNTESFCPAFLMFLDCVHQVMNQFAPAFEFSHFFVRYIAFHSCSGYFRSFLEANDNNRIDMENIAPEVNDPYGRTIWSFIKAERQKSAIFLNPMFDGGSSGVLCPSSSIASIVVWKFFTEEYFHHGSPYDLEIVEEELKQNKTFESDEKSSIVIDETKQCTELRENGFSKTFKSFGKSRNSFETLCKQHATNNTNAKEVQENYSLQEAVQRKNALDMFQTAAQLSRDGFDIDDPNDISGPGFSKTKRHRLVLFSAGLIPAKCGRCGHMITKWSSAIQCKKCRFHVHQHCVEREFVAFGINHVLDVAVPVDEMQLPTAAILDTTQTLPASGLRDERRQSITAAVEDRSSPLTLQVPVPPLCSGYLSKRGAKFKLWAPRYFVLYADVPRVWYYEDVDQWKRRVKACGYIDLAEFSGIDIEDNGRRAIIELKTKTRSYWLLSEDRAEAFRWKECIEQVIKE